MLVGFLVMCVCVDCLFQCGITALGEWEDRWFAVRSNSKTGWRVSETRTHTHTHKFISHRDVFFYVPSHAQTHPRLVPGVATS